MESYSDYIVNTKVLKNNAENIRELIGKETKFCAVVKANAYGLGLETVCNSINEFVDFYAVANLQEALKIRVFDKKTKIIVLGIVSENNLKLCSDNDISISVSNLDYLKRYILKAKSLLNVHIQINTGLNRFGFRKISEFKSAIKLIENCDNINLEGIYSHFATKFNDITFIKKQYIRFLQFKKYVNSNVICHIANSYATTLDEKFRLDMIRSGFLLYGGQANDINNKLVLTIKSKIINIFEVKKQDTIGYDRTYLVDKKKRIAVIPLGYADGIDRGLSNKFSVLIDGKFCPIVGLICMDVFMVDISNVFAEIGSEVVLLGKQGHNKITLNDYARVLNTSPYEILLKFRYNRMNYIVK